MITLSQIESGIKDSIKAKDQVKADTLRGLKLRIVNEQIAKKTKGAAEELSEEEILALVKSEVKRRKEAAEAFKNGGRQELADKEMKEAEILLKYLPAQLSEEELVKEIEQIIAKENAAVKDFGKIMGILKSKFGSKADGAVLAKILKEKLK